MENSIRKSMLAWMFSAALMLCAVAFAEDSLRLNGTVVGLDGSPSSGTTVLMAGMDRMNMVGIGEAASLPGYHAVSDGQGHFQFLFTPVHGSSVSGGPDRSRPPGFGDYYLIVLPAMDGSHAGAISPRIDNSFNRSGMRLDSAGTSLTLQIRRGVEVSGRVVDPDGKPLAGKTVTIFHDLHAETHTGRGGEIYEQTAKSGPDGAFRFERIYPGLQTIQADRWTKVRYSPDGPWSGDVPEEVNVVEHPYLEIMELGENRFEYRGIIRDDQGRPVPEAQVSAGVSYHQTPVTWADFHAFPGSNPTDAEGRFLIATGTPWLRGFIVRKDGYEEINTLEEEPLAAADPAKSWDFVLHPLPPLALSGALVDAAGRPAAGKKVLLAGVEHGQTVDIAQAALRPHWQAVTDAAGAFRFEFLAPVDSSGFWNQEPDRDALPGYGVYRLFVRPEPGPDGHSGAIGPLIDNEPGTLFASNSQNKRTAPLSVKPGGGATISLRLAPQRILRGRVLDESLQPVSRQDVILFYNLQDSLRDAYQPIILTQSVATTGEDGRYAFDNALATTQTLDIPPPALWVRSRSADSGPWAARTLDRVNPTEADSGYRDIEITGFSDADFRGTVRDAGGKPLANASVSIYFLRYAPKNLQDPEGRYQRHSTVKTDSDGGFRIPALSPWPVVAEVFKNGFIGEQRQFDPTPPEATSSSSRVLEFILNPEPSAASSAQAQRAQ